MKLGLASLLAFSALTLACGGTAPPPEAPPAPEPPPPSQPPAEPPTGPTSPADEAPPPAAEAPRPNPFAEQVAAGQLLYGKHCAECHGPSGNDGKAPAVVGLDQGALPLDPPKKAKTRKTQFKTVADVADYVVKTMPPKTAGTLGADEYWAILAFDLHANGVELDQKLEPALAATLEIPRKK